MIKKEPAQFERITEANCDCCGNEIQTIYGGLTEDHLIFSGWQKGKILNAIICIKCMEEKLSFINIQKKDNTIGYC